jgi:hypothetical protein
LKSRTEVEELLADHDLDDHAVAAEAMRQVAPDLEKLDRALRNIEDLRAGQANGVREASDRLLDNNLLALSDSHLGAS